MDGSWPSIRAFAFARRRIFIRSPFWFVCTNERVRQTDDGPPTAVAWSPHFSRHFAFAFLRAPTTGVEDRQCPWRIFTIFLLWISRRSFHSLLTMFEMVSSNDRMNLYVLKTNLVILFAFDTKHFFYLFLKKCILIQLYVNLIIIILTEIIIV